MDLHRVGSNYNQGFIYVNLDPSEMHESEKRYVKSHHNLTAKFTKCTCKCTCNSQNCNASCKKSPSDPVMSRFQRNVKVPADLNCLLKTNNQNNRLIPSNMVSFSNIPNVHEQTCSNVLETQDSCRDEEVRKLLLQLSLKKEGLEKKMNVLQDYKSALLRKMNQISSQLNTETSLSLSGSDRTDSRDSGVASIYNDHISKPKHPSSNPVKSILKKTSPNFENDTKYYQKEKGCPNVTNSAHFERNCVKPIKRPISVDDQLFLNCVDRAKVNCKITHNDCDLENLLDFIDDRSSDPPSPAPMIPEKLFSYPCQYFMK